MNVFSAEQLYEADKVTTERQGITSTDLMERAATQIFNWLHTRMQGAQVPIHIFCGIGNNGGDGLALGRLLIQSGYNVNVYIANFTDKRSKCFLINYGRIKDVTKKWPILMKGEEDFPEIHPDDIIVDALFGIGLNRAPEGWVKSLIQYLNAEKAFKLAIDIPSGLSANGPVLDPDAVLNANHTLTFQTPKLAFFLPDTGKYVPYFEALDIGLDQEYQMMTRPLARVVVKPIAQTFYKQRPKYAHKGDFGHSFLVGGSRGKIGAMALATKASLRSGSGLATTFVPACGHDILIGLVPEAMVVCDENETTITQTEWDTSNYTIGVGPGMGQEKETLKAFEALLSNAETPMVIDADAINLLAANPKLIEEVPKGSIFTPHPGELKRLVGEWDHDIGKLEKAKEFSKAHEVIIVVKGANTVTVFGDDLYINSTGNPGMATAGSGDVLTGIITGLLAQGYEPLVAAMFGVYLHGSAGNLATQELGFEALLAGDIVDTIGAAFLELFRQEPAPEAPPEEA
ncbi:NAD(P)H-hydrate dehydratase [Aureisphaera galaxeae]|uniref:NAD(P)H-hydrate dehydratase n=1 Tax=Aureisphaera galaxeae TaxID=1538023 RepID=UPI0023504286|nr:NAD(P)H-hydrate dehydratase [Aureisphaera galaxeae]MDC8004124.1 NAD(P)H-hydrate dehydratase [Aureisphaera galaxeae]